ncbi:TetR/AcrR family transcriptional regulator C-terminal domain-containing protein [Shimazuella sp. AN120528]|uniref:TetR/AcrR family transcriptional regulator C-terminal domain-containing protein n=1 Tax=Shimazuella soli TaxID=1892854 RepID=UPI001F0FF00E|nr:TetR/AcrR family transcriptional regulator C-terminal domain-containing protein [Shimazuella soli]MCH5585001.1 TetR/AcrR family transcriptional regulator C-terminal domain-containing protein [Shimazuella soli]
MSKSMKKIIGYPTEESIHPLSRDRIVEAALQLLLQMNLKELSMRKIASKLDVKAAALYYHVKNKDELLQLLTDEISVQMGEEWLNPSLTWREQIMEWSSAFRKALKAYPNAVDIFTETIAISYHRLLQIEWLYSVLAKAGFGDEQIPWAASMLKNHVVGFVAEEVRKTGFANKEEDSRVEAESYTSFFEDLPVDQFPHMIRLAEVTTKPDWEKEFQFGIGVLLDGFEKRLKKENQ